MKNLKKYAKVLLASTRLPVESWPLAMSYAAQHQRRRALTQATETDVPFGTKVALKSKVFGTGGSYDLDPRWREGRFVGFSSDVRNGLVVRYEDGTFVTSCHVRDGLVDAEAVADDEVIVADLPVPARRLRAKARLALIINPVEDLEAYARELDVDEMYGVENVMRIWERLKNISKPKRRGAKAAVGSDSGESFYAGCFAHGGVRGIMNMARKLPNTTAYLVKAAKEIAGEDHSGVWPLSKMLEWAPTRTVTTRRTLRTPSLP